MFLGHLGGGAYLKTIAFHDRCYREYSCHRLLIRELGFESAALAWFFRRYINVATPLPESDLVVPSADLLGRS